MSRDTIRHGAAAKPGDVLAKAAAIQAIVAQVRPKISPAEPLGNGPDRAGVCFPAGSPGATAIITVRNEPNRRSAGCML
ncbi:hypothetical protein ColTof4_13296 [Colletotrichum tofieldiae]|nr:hypothetical protein ColTof3_00627 [Colletotrichum tofieldiae]GKT80873.1 hypothetical protein ColTof4_13296 [Colletotrichum tofieldiae]GKT88292.1 hypothetical protein Ct61P_06142 [Colletotrichum tofieldiae]